MDGRVTPPKRVTSPAWGPPPPCKQALSQLGQPTYEMTPGFKHFTEMQGKKLFS